MRLNIKKMLFLCFLALILLTVQACSGEKGEGDVLGYEGPYSEYDGTYGGVDALGRVLADDTQAPAERDRKVGIFYFLWLGQHNTDKIRNNYEIVQAHPEAVESESAWLKAGGGETYSWHYWGESIFGYYTSLDTWVYRKHLQMLTDAGIDFIMFDTTNGFTYNEPMRALIGVWYEYLEKGYDVPKLCFYTNSNSGITINNLYSELYADKELHEQYPRLDELWFTYEGKPLIVGNPEDGKLSSRCKNFFRIKTAVWPNTSRVSDDSFPWMEFTRLLTDEAVYGSDGRKEVVSVSIAQHSETCLMSAAAWYGSNDRTRSWHDGANDTSEDAMYYGYNFQEQWDWAISVDPEMVFVTGWNEWCAQRLPGDAVYPIRFCDNCDPNTSRDAEPVKGLFGDNYYMQLINNIRLYKGVKPRVDTGENFTVDIKGNFSQWDDVCAKYTDYSGDTKNRTEKGIAGTDYTDNSGRNDFVLLKTAKDRKYIYFYAETAEDIKGIGEGQWMTLFIRSGANGNALWENLFDFAVNYESPENGSAVISKYAEDGKWSAVGKCEMKIQGNKIMIAVPRNILGISEDGGRGLVDIQFKWADAYLTDEDGNIDIFSFYTSGDAAPIGRLTYIFSEKA